MKKKSFIAKYIDKQCRKIQITDRPNKSKYANTRMKQREKEQ